MIVTIVASPVASGGKPGARSAAGSDGKVPARAEAQTTGQCVCCMTVEGWDWGKSQFVCKQCQVQIGELSAGVYKVWMTETQAVWTCVMQSL
jgi:hypothetical protein